MDKPPHGIYQQQIQEVALNTKSIEAGVYQTIPNLRCRLFKNAPETVQHKMQACEAYSECNNKVADIVHRNICSRYVLEVLASKWKTLPKVI